MGADYQGQEKAIEILRTMPVEAREFIAHHLRNSLAGAIGNIDLARRNSGTSYVEERLKRAMEGLDHAVADLVRIGC